MRKVPDGATVDNLSSINQTLHQEITQIKSTISATIAKIKQEREEDKNRHNENPEPDEIVSSEKKLELY